MKIFRPIFVIAAILLAGSVCAQEVGTEIQKKKVLLEEYTGLNCSWCVQGHKISSSLLNVYGDNMFVVNVHSGSLAVPHNDQPEFRIAEGDSLDSYFGRGQMGYPSGSVNRLEVEEGRLVTGRGNWALAAEYVRSQDAPVNLGVKSIYDGETNKLTVSVVGYFTGDVDGTDQRLNIVWTQDDIVGYQNGSTDSYSYSHQHMLRGFITSLWGDAIDNVKKGQSFTKSYEIVLPDSVGSVKVKPEDINVVTFVTEGRENVGQVEGGKPEYVNCGNAEVGELRVPNIEVGNRWGYNYFEVKLKNRSACTIKNATFEVTVNGETTTSTVDCNIDQFGIAELQVPAKLSYAEKGKTKYSIKLTAMNGNSVEPSELTGKFQRPAYTGTTVDVDITTDMCASQNRFMLKDADGNLLREFGPFPDGQISTLSETIEGLEEGKTYCIEITDEAGDGMAEGEKGSLVTHSTYGRLIDQFYSVAGFGLRSFFIVDTAAGIDAVATDAKSAEPTEVYDLTGRRNSASKVSISRMPDGSVKKIVRK